MTEKDSLTNEFKGKIYQPQGEVLATILIGPGLNLNPIKMEPMALELTKKGYAVCLINFSQYGESSLDVVWERETMNLFNKLPQDIREKDIFIVAYSLSSLHFLDLIKKEKIKAKAMVSFAPPFKTKPLLTPIKLFSKLPVNMKLGSLNYSEYRYRRSTTVNEYKALFKLKDQEFYSDKKLLKIPHRIYLSAKDEVIHYKKIKKIISPLTNWNCMDINRDKSVNYTYHHLMIDSYSLGEKAFSEILDGIDSFFKNQLSY